jgi:hypothetical protein
MLGDPLDRPVLAGPVASLENDQVLNPLLDRPFLIPDERNQQLAKSSVVVDGFLGHAAKPDLHAGSWQ